MRTLFICLGAVGIATIASSQTAQPDWTRLEDETMRHFQALVRIDTTDPPGGEAKAVEYLKQALEKEGIPTKTFALESHRPNLVARLKGSGKKRPLLVMAHTDTVNVDPKKWTFPPFSATRDGGWVYGRGTIDDKDNVVAALMMMLTLKRAKVPLDRDIIFLAEAGEEGSTRVGIQFMVEQHFDDIDAEFCLAEGGSVSRQDGQVKYASVQTLEKIPYAVDITAKGVAGHGSVPLQSNSIAHLSKAVAALSDWRPPIRLNETTATYFQRLAQISPPDEAAMYRAILDPATAKQADDYFVVSRPSYASMVRSAISPNVIDGGYRINVIPSEAKASFDFRALPDENIEAFLETMRTIVNDPAVDVRLGQRDTRPAGKEARLDSEAFKTIESAITKHYATVTLPTMSTGATDMAYLRARGVQSYGIGPAIDAEDGPQGFGSHSDQERILESELHRFVRFHYDVVFELARAK